MQDILEQPITTRRVIFICAILFAIMALLSLIAANNPFIPKFPKDVSTSGNNIRLSDANIEVASNANIMGEVPVVVKEPEKPKSEVAEAPKPKPKPKKKPLNIKVLGLIASNNHNLSYAIIQEGGKKQKSYAVGEELEDGETKIKDIESEHVVFERDGDEEIAYLLKPIGQTSGAKPNTPLPSNDDPFADSLIDEDLFDDINSINSNRQSSIQYTPPANNERNISDDIDDELYDDTLESDSVSRSEQAAELVLSGGFEDLPEELEEQLQQEIEQYQTSLENGTPPALDSDVRSFDDESFSANFGENSSNELKPNVDYDPFLEEDGRSINSNLR